MTVTLGSLLKKKPKYGINAAAAAHTSSLPAYIRITDIDTDGRFFPDPLVSVDSPQSRNYILQDGDIVIARTGASVGKSYRYRKSDGELVFAGFLICITPDEKKLDPVFAGYYLQSKPYWDWIAAESVRSGQPGINAQQLMRLDLDLPDIQHQREIGSRLSDVDNLISFLELLISKKQSIKQGVMHELLTGRTRLPGFDAKWSTEKMGSILRVRHGRSQAGIEKSNGRYPILATGGEIGRTNIPIYSHPSVLIGRKGTIDRPQYRDEPFWTVDTLFYTEIFPRAVPLYIFYLFQTIDWKSMNEASGVPSLNSSRIESIEVVLPSLEEQKAIAQILQDVDQEIDTLERRLESARNIKQGMMQELLTGRTRLPVEEVSS